MPRHAWSGIGSDLLVVGAGEGVRCTFPGCAPRRVRQAVLQSRVEGECDLPVMPFLILAYALAGVVLMSIQPVVGGIVGRKAPVRVIGWGVAGSCAALSIATILVSVVSFGDLDPDHLMPPTAKWVAERVRIP